MSRTRAVSATMYLPDRGCCVDCTGDVSPSTPAYFDKAWGNWLPGDDPEVDVLSVMTIQEEDGPVLPRELEFEGLSAKDQDRITYNLLDAAQDLIRDEYNEASEREYEDSLDRKRFDP